MMSSPETSSPGSYLRGVLAEGVGRAPDRLAPPIQPLVELRYTRQPVGDASSSVFTPPPFDPEGMTPDEGRLVGMHHRAERIHEQSPVGEAQQPEASLALSADRAPRTTPPEAAALVRDTPPPATRSTPSDGTFVHDPPAIARPRRLPADAEAPGIEPGVREDASSATPSSAADLAVIGIPGVTGRGKSATSAPAAHPGSAQADAATRQAPAAETAAPVMVRTASAQPRPAPAVAAAPREPQPAGTALVGRPVLERIEELQRTTEQLAAKLAVREPTPLPPPPVVIVNRVAAPPAAPRAFWERSYLGRATLRVRR